MKFEKDELPHAADVTTARGLKKGEILFDQDGIPWVMSDEEHRKHDATRGVWLVGCKQLVYENNTDGTSRLKARLVECLLEYPDGELIPVYTPESIIEVVEKDMDKYLSR